MAHFVCQERYGTVISKHGKQTERVARFLKPCARSSDEAERISGRAHLLFEEMSSREKGWPKKVSFQGWACPQRNWENWVEKLEGKHSVMWKQTGIYDAIMSSCFEIKRNKEIVLGLVEFWCSEMNTFVFPWGEATITLEDVMILGGFSVLGERVEKAVTTEELKMVIDAMRERKAAMARGRSRKTSHGAWMKHFMENGNDSEFEHVAFLSLWLSRYVFPLRSSETISKEVFSIAAHLAGGTQMALAPAILAGLYKNLSLLKEKALASYSDDEITVFAPFQLVLLWAFERFPDLVQNSPNVLIPGEPRAARWYKVVCNMDKSVINRVFISGQCFQWRPYAADVSNWNHSSYYRVEEHLEVDSEKNSDEVLQCYLICMSRSYLIGLDCQERYMPHRVAMQFGIDQDLPGDFSGLSFGPKDVSFFVPPRSFEPGISLKYFNWWKNSEFMCGGKLPDVLRRSSDTFQMPPAPGESEMNSKDDHTPSVATRLKNSETVSQSMKYEPTEILDDEREFDKWSNNYDVLFKTVCESGFPTREAGSLEKRSPSIEEKRLKNSETVSQSMKYEAIEILDDEREFDKWSGNYDVLFKMVCESGFPTREAGSLEKRSPSIEEKRLKNSETVSQSMKYEPIEILDDEREFDKWSNNYDVLFKTVCESGFPTKEAGSLEKRPPSIEEVKGGVGCCTLAKSFGSGSPECSTPCSVGVRSSTSVTSKSSPTQAFQESVEADHVAVAGTSKQMAKDSNEIDDNPPSDSRHRANGLGNGATSDEVHPNESIRKRKWSTSTEESSDCKETISMINGNTDELQGEYGKATMDVDERDFEIQKLDLEKRIEKLEKLMGISPDRG